eukprot:6664691-Prymnesium_polylepis.2
MRSMGSVGRLCLRLGLRALAEPVEHSGIGTRVQQVHDKVARVRPCSAQADGGVQRRVPIRIHGINRRAE